MRALALSAALIFTPFTNATTQQDSPPLAPGQRVRITAPSFNVSKLQTTLLEFRADPLVAEALAAPPAHVPLLVLSDATVPRSLAFERAELRRPACVPLSETLRSGILLLPRRPPDGCDLSREGTPVARPVPPLQGAGKGAVWGGAIGGLVGFIAGLVLSQACESDSGAHCEPFVIAIGTVGGAAVGAGIGALIGAM
jgi:hypothetical protein